MASTINAKTTGVGGIDASGDASGILQLQTGGTAALTIDTSQNVGIGMTASPNYKLDVNGSARFLQSNAPTSGAIVLRQSSGDTYPAYIQWVNNANSAERGYITIDTASNFYLSTSGSTRISAVGANIGINTVSPVNALSVSGDTDVSAGNAYNCNLYYNSGWKYRGNGYGGWMKVGDGTGAFSLNLASNNSSGAAASATPIEVLNIDNAGNTNFRYQVAAKMVDAAGYSFRSVSSSTNRNEIQFVGNTLSEQAYIGSPAYNILILRSTLGSSSSVTNNVSEFNFYGGHAVIRAVTSAGGDIGDWPTPVLALTGYDSNFGYQTFQTFALRDDAAAYQTGASVWNFRMYQGSTGQTTSNSNTALELTGPGVLRMQAGASNGVQLLAGATAWTSWSDERMKDIIEPIENAAEKVSTLRTVIGKYKTDADGTRRSMLIAQDVEKVLPESVSLAKHIGPIDENDIYKLPEENERLALAYTEVIPLLTAAIKELTERIKVLENK